MGSQTVDPNPVVMLANESSTKRPRATVPWIGHSQSYGLRVCLDRTPHLRSWVCFNMCLDYHLLDAAIDVDVPLRTMLRPFLQTNALFMAPAGGIEPCS